MNKPLDWKFIAGVMAAARAVERSCDTFDVDRAPHFMTATRSASGDYIRRYDAIKAIINLLEEENVPVQSESD